MSICNSSLIVKLKVSLPIEFLYMIFLQSTSNDHNFKIKKIFEDLDPVYEKSLSLLSNASYFSLI